MNNKIIFQKEDLIGIILEDFDGKLNYCLRKDKPNIKLIDVLNEDKNQHETIIIKYINYLLNRFNQPDDLQIRLYVINILYRMIYLF